MPFIPLGRPSISGAGTPPLRPENLQSGRYEAKELVLAGGKHGVFRSANLETGTDGWALYGDGTAEFNDVTIRGDIESANWDGASPANLATMDASASAGFYLDSSAGAAQFNGNVWIDGTVQIGQSADGYISFLSSPGGTSEIRFGNVWTLRGDVGGWTIEHNGNADGLSVDGNDSPGGVSLMTDNVHRLTARDASVTATVPILLPVGTAGAPALAFESDTDLGLYRATTDDLGIVAGGSWVARFRTGDIITSVPIRASAGGPTAPTFSFDSDSNTGMYSGGADSLRFATGGTFRFLIAPHFGSNTTGIDASSTTARVAIDADSIQAVNSASLAAIFGRNSNGGVVDFRRSGTQVGTVAVTTTNTAYNTSSDARLKHNIVPFTGALDLLGRLKVRSYQWKATNVREVGLIAQEVEEVIPQVVQVPKGGVENYQVDYGRLTPWVIRGVQELMDRIEELEARLAKLEA